MRIVKLDTFDANAGWRNISFLKISTDEGLVGWAEYNENFGVGGVGDLLRRFEPVVVGMDPRPVGKITATLHALTLMAPGGLNNQAIAAIENACLDIKAKALGVPVCALFGGPFRDRLDVYWSHCGTFRAAFPDLFESFGKKRIETYDDLSDLAREAKARGFKAVKTNPLRLVDGKLKMFDSGFRPHPKLLDRQLDHAFLRSVVDTLRAFREGFGPEPGLMIDLNFAQRAEGWLRVARAVEPFDLTWLEIEIHDPLELARVRERARVPIASLETIHGMRSYRPYLDAGAVDVAIIDVMWNGVWESVRAATLADARFVDVAAHNFCGGLASLMSAHFCAAVPNLRIMEIEIDDVPWMGDFLTAPLRIENGEFVMPTAPGWGADVNEAAVKAHPPKAPPARR